MKKRLILIPLIGLFMSIGASLCWAQQIIGPSMSLVENTFDTGEIIAGSLIEHSFKVFNEGDSPLKITKVTTS